MVCTSCASRIRYLLMNERLQWKFDNVKHTSEGVASKWTSSEVCPSTCSKDTPSVVGMLPSVWPCWFNIFIACSRDKNIFQYIYVYIQVFITEFIIIWYILFVFVVVVEQISSSQFKSKVLLIFFSLF